MNEADASGRGARHAEPRDTAAGGTAARGAETTAATSIDPERVAIDMVRTFAAPRALVFRQWIEPESLADWFAPDGFVVTACEVDPRPGGRWLVRFEDAAGTAHTESGELRDIVPSERLVFTLTQEDARGHRGPETLVTVQFVERSTGQGSVTEMTFTQTGYERAAMRDGNAEGWRECFAKLAARLAPASALAASDADQAEREIRELFAAWARASAAKDIDGSMAPVAEDVWSYEHETPLQVRGAAAMRAICQRGYDSTPGDAFLWTVPDLQVIVRGDLAVTWGLNRMQAFDAGREAATSWSRGTRVFQKIDGAWRMIHQHVSFPYDPATGAAVMDLAPY